MERPLYPCKNMRITQGYNEGTHLDSFAIDDAGKDTNISKIRAPYTGIIKKIYKDDANEVWLESIDKVEYPDGTKDYLTMMFAHANDVSDLFVGKRISQNEEFYSEGKKGNATGNHCHFECGKGKFTGTGWHKNSSGYYSINNGKRPEECLWLDKEVNIINNNNYNFKTIIEEMPSSSLPKEEKENKNEEPKETPIFICSKSDLYGIYLKAGQKLYLK